ncbi:short-chain dehydrogenase [Intrasporangium chromatireducens Q5-1]|uniref:Short-chain dehydrogenase n=1 Tax=Intrasporangium chromatireducens Q5-1 TaxID=584657 RepID=W9GJJ6_9MICO|nr:NAD(P)-dependent oxidoreductase [Intrasporangium chromatireducens]EWT05327.1 short-chain dehydrogenase [Intrasporangium chromatireducens Q5-1]
MSTSTLSGKTIIMSGGSRGIGLAIAVAAARQGANVAILAKTDRADPRLPGTVHTAVAAIQEAGGQGLAVVGDVRDEADVDRAVAATISAFGGIDICVNNASALNLDGTEDIAIKRFDLMQQIQVRGTFLLSRAALPYLRKTGAGQILSLSPPLNLKPHWLGAHPAYMVAKYGMTLMTLGIAAEYSQRGVTANTLWPESLIRTAAVENLLGGESSMRRARSPEIMADAAVALLSSPMPPTGQSLIDADLLRGAGVDLARYGALDGFDYDIFVDRPSSRGSTATT